MFEEMSELYETLDKGLTPPSVLFPHAPTKAHATRDRARVGISKLFSTILERRRRDPEGAVQRSDIIKMRMDFRYKDGTAFLRTTRSAA
jgi:sterol 14-demethylase